MREYQKKNENFYGMSRFKQTKVVYIVLIVVNVLALSISLIEPYDTYRLLIYLINTPLSLLMALMLNHNFQSKRVFSNPSAILLSLGIFSIYTYFMTAMSIPGIITIAGLFLIVILTIVFQTSFFYLINENRKLKPIALFIVLIIVSYLLLFKYSKTSELPWYLSFNVILLVNSIYSFVSFYRSARKI